MKWKERKELKKFNNELKLRVSDLTAEIEFWQAKYKYLLNMMEHVDTTEIEIKGFKP